MHTPATGQLFSSEQKFMLETDILVVITLCYIRPLSCLQLQVLLL